MSTTPNHLQPATNITSDEGSFPVINPDPVPFETRTIAYDNGSTEITRIIDDDNLQHWSKSNPLAFEASVVWLRPIDDQPYVRVALITNSETRRGKLILNDGKRKAIGYSKLTADAPRLGVDQHYQRRVFYIKTTDPVSYSQDPKIAMLPVGALDPMTILPTIRGEPPQRGVYKQLYQNFIDYMSG
ncbi:MAG: hypothetical protein GY917_06305 [Planctomycetaceae bacterium]|nr:hypothetical protein [Planctomycetaceae bacterium]